MHAFSVACSSTRTDKHIILSYRHIIKSRLQAFRETVLAQLKCSVRLNTDWRGRRSVQSDPIWWMGDRQKLGGGGGGFGRESQILKQHCQTRWMTGTAGQPRATWKGKWRPSDCKFMHPCYPAYRKEDHANNIITIPTTTAAKEWKIKVIVPLKSKSFTPYPLPKTGKEEQKHQKRSSLPYTLYLLLLLARLYQLLLQLSFLPI